MIMQNFYFIAFIVFAAYFLSVTIYYGAMNIIGLLEDRKRMHEDEIEDYTPLSKSSFTIPISIIVPAHNEETWISDCVHSILALNYPNYELIVVDDGSTDKTFSVLQEFLQLKDVTAGYTHVDPFNSGKFKALFKSEKYPNVTVMQKDDGTKKAGAINAALHLAKHNYICIIDADTVLEPDALLKVMDQVEKDPERIIGIGSYFGLVNGFKIKKGKILEKSFSFHPLAACQNLEYIRSFIGNRIAWSKFNAMPLVSGGFGVWRKDILIKWGGLSHEFTSEDIEFTFRAHDLIVKNKKNYRIVMLPYAVGWTEGPQDLKSLVSQRSRWQRVTNETVWHYRHMLWNPRYKGVGFLSMPYFLLYESLGVFFELASLIITGIGFLTGYLDLKMFLSFYLLMLLTHVFSSLSSVYTFIQHRKCLTAKYLAYLVGLSFIEFLWYRPIMTYAKLKGTLGFVKGERAYDSIRRVGPKAA